MMMMMVVIIILLIVVVVKTYETKEKFGNLQIRRMISNASLKSNSTDETEQDLEDVDTSLNQKPLKEGYVVGRSNLIGNGKFDYLMKGKQDKPSFRQSDKTIVQEIGDSVKEKVQAMTEQIAESNMTQDQEVSEMQNPDPEITEAVPEEEKTYETEAASEGDITVLAKDDVVSNSGKGIEASGSESFGLTRLNNDFSLFKTDSKASEVAQSEEVANSQKSIDMMNYVKKFMSDLK